MADVRRELRRLIEPGVVDHTARIRRDDVIAAFQQLKMSDALIEKLVNVGLLAEAQDVCLAPAFRAAPVERLKEREARAATGTEGQPFGEVGDAGSAAALQKPVDDAPSDPE